MIDDIERYQHVMPYVHQMTRTAKLAAAMVAISLTDLDSTKDRAEAMAWLEHKDDAAASFQTCCQALANLNGFLRYHGVDLEPEAMNVQLPSDANNVTGLNADSLPILSTEADVWLHVIEECASEGLTQEKREQFAKQLVGIVDRQVQACYQHLHAQLPEMANQDMERRGEAWLEDQESEQHGLIFSSDTPGR
jgi:hypothetical protein